MLSTLTLWAGREVGQTAEHMPIRKASKFNFFKKFHFLKNVQVKQNLLGDQNPPLWHQFTTCHLTGMLAVWIFLTLQ